MYLMSFLTNPFWSFPHSDLTHLLVKNLLAFPRSPNRPFSVSTQSYLLAYQRSFIPHIYLACLNRSLFWVRSYLTYCLCTMPSTTEAHSWLFLLYFKKKKKAFLRNVNSWMQHSSKDVIWKYQIFIIQIELSVKFREKT